MKLMRGLQQLSGQMKSCVVTIGSFDGMHLGHQQLIKKCCDTAAALNLPSVLITFEPQPKEYFSSQPAVRLMRFAEKWEYLKDSKIDYVLCVRFNQPFAAMAAEDFVRNILVAQLGIKAIIVGDDYHFGANRRGDFSLLQALGQPLGFQVIAMPTCVLAGSRVSSSRVRVALAQGDCDRALQLLNRPFRLTGCVVHGNKRGRQLGFPTANMNLHRALLPVSGVFAVRVQGATEKTMIGAASVGTRPVFAGQKVILEVHILDFDGDIYGARLQVDFLHKLREEENFMSVNALVQQIEQDVKDVRAYF